MSEGKLIVGEDMICPMTKEHCDDECCTPGSECNCQTNLIVSGNPPSKTKAFDLQKAILGAKVMTRSRNYTGQYLLTLQGCLHPYPHVFKMTGPEGERLLQVDENGEYFNNSILTEQACLGNPYDLTMAPEVKTVWINFYLDAKNNIHSTAPQTSEADALSIKGHDYGVWRFIETKQIVLEY